MGFNLTGASGTLDFNEYGEPAYGPISMWQPDESTGTFTLTPIIDADGLLISVGDEETSEVVGETGQGDESEE